MSPSLSISMPHGRVLGTAHVGSKEMIFFFCNLLLFVCLGEVSQLLLSFNLENWLELANSRTLPVNVGQTIFYFFPLSLGTRQRISILRYSKEELSTERNAVLSFCAKLSTASRRT